MTFLLGASVRHLWAHGYPQEPRGDAGPGEDRGARQPSRQLKLGSANSSSGPSTQARVRQLKLGSVNSSSGPST
jgi:hypothetical protein